MPKMIETIFEGFIQYTLIGVIIALLVMFILLILLYERNRIMDLISVEFLQDKFDQLCEISDRLDEPYRVKNPFGNAMWLTRLIYIDVLAAGGLIFLWAMFMAIR